MSNVIIDRRKNPGGKNSPNRQKFIQRARGKIKESIKRNLGGRSIQDSDKGENVKVKRRSVSEPEFQNDPNTGEMDRVLPGNQEYTVGDEIPVPQGGGGQGPGGEASDGGEGSDDFEFAISNDEYVDMLFEDLELPHMTKKESKVVEAYERNRAGFSNEGNPSQLNLVQSMRNSIGRRIALKKPKAKRIAEIEAELEKLKPNTKKYKELMIELEALKRRHKRIPFLDPTDLRFNNYDYTPKPTSQAVIFMIMDVSGSMGAHHKDLAKRFFTLLNLFISRKYKRTEVVFIRHHHEAEITDEHDFFYKRETGGTVVSSAYKLMLEEQKKNYPADKWNIYVAQATDGDNFTSDNKELKDIVENDVLPIVQYLSYILVSNPGGYEDLDSFGFYGYNGLPYPYNMMSGMGQDLTKTMKKLSEEHDNMICKSVSTQSEVYPIFREIFKKR